MYGAYEEAFWASAVSVVGSWHGVVRRVAQDEASDGGTGLR